MNKGPWPRCVVRLQERTVNGYKIIKPRSNEGTRKSNENHSPRHAELKFLIKLQSIITSHNKNLLTQLFFNPVIDSLLMLPQWRPYRQ